VGAKRIIGLSVAAVLASIAADRCMAAASDRGARLAAMCAACHRLDGHDRGIPTIVGLDKKSLVGAMADFKSGARSGGSQIMHGVALSLTDDDIAAVADYLAALPTGAKQQ
jgi:cytochrome subunit of sulfide dehydrogenase